MKYFKVLTGVFCFLVSFILYFYTQSDSLAFADAAEFGLVSFLGSVAHPPGMPSYIFFHFIWLKFSALFSENFIILSNLFSIVSASIANLLLYFILCKLIYQLYPDSKKKNEVSILCAIATLSFAFGGTSWYWANTTEVYSFQILSLAILLFGLIYYHFAKSFFYMIIAALGFSFAAANHHLTLILLCPFIPFFLSEKIFPGFEKIKSQKKSVTIKNSIWKIWWNGFTKLHFWIFVLIASVLTVLFYLWMSYRAGSTFLYTFGEPNTLERLIFHIKGGPYLKMFDSSTLPGNIISLNLPYLLRISFFQYSVFLPFLFFGFYYLIKQKKYILIIIPLLYYLFMFYILMKSKNSTGDADAYLLPAFLVSFLIVIYGFYFIYQKTNLLYWLILLLPVQAGWNYNSCDRSGFDVSESIMRELDLSSPKNSIVIIADWTTVIQYYYYRIVKKFRTDLIVLNYDIKFTNYKILENLYPDFYFSIQKEYMEFVRELENEHPQQVYNTGCDLNTPKLVEKFSLLLKKIDEVSVIQKRQLLIDPKSVYTYSNQNFYKKSFFPSGCFVSINNSGANPEFIYLRFKWLDSPILLNESGAHDKTVDIEAMLDFHKQYYQNINNQEMLNQVQMSLKKVKEVQRKMRKKMPFVGL